MNYGISNLSIVPMRNEAADQSEMVNQVIFGEHFKVLEIRKKWSKIRLAHDSYEGWICNKQWIEIEEDIYKQLDKEVATITTDILDIITKTHHQPIVIGSILPSYKSGHALINNEMYQFDGLTTPGFIKKDKLDKNNNYFEFRSKKAKIVRNRSNFNFFVFHLSSLIMQKIRNIFLKFLLKRKFFVKSYLGKVYSN